MTKTYFVVGTDTEVGKTFCTSILLSALSKTGRKVSGLKPIASDSQFGKFRDYSGLINDDAMQILNASDVPLSYQQVNPITFEKAIAPHIAAVENGVTLDKENLKKLVRVPDSDICLIEGAGGWLTPLNEVETYADWVSEESFEVILVVGMKLGCLNHAQLTAESIRNRGVKIKGWIANQLTAYMPVYQENLSWLKSYFKEPLLAEIKYKQQLSDFEHQSLELLFD